MRKAKLGQNFLRDSTAARRIVDALGDITQSTVIEIGPGHGALTKILSERAARLIAIELDTTLAAKLRRQFESEPRVRIIEANFLKKKINALERHGLHEHVKVVGNIPYYITSDILLHLFAQHDFIDTIVIMVQKEVAERIAAKPASRDYGLLTVTAQLFTDIEQLFTLPPSAFSPPPKVHSAVLRLRVAPKSTELNLDPDAFLKFCKLAFSQKRKTLANNLRARYGADDAKAVLAKAGLAEDIRAEALSLERLGGVFKALSKS